ncbi:MAG: hypothetical protein JWN87_2143 [Frankiales bacterium]|nr:hypothetical protein [Frankiales bacterium]
MLWGVVWLVVGLGCLAGFVAYTSAIDARTQDLIDNGEQVIPAAGGVRNGHLFISRGTAFLRAT